jgi:hypothetical protein
MAGLPANGICVAPAEPRQGGFDLADLLCVPSLSRRLQISVQAFENSVLARRRPHQLAAKTNGPERRHVLVARDGLDLGFGQVGKTNQIGQGNHLSLPHEMPGFAGLMRAFQIGGSGAERQIPECQMPK